jgi:hypothetical protein
MQRYLPNPNPDSKSYGKRSWRVVGHPESLNMRNVSFKVNENRRQGVVQTGTKQVHAFVRGILAEDKDLVETTERVKYNPFKNSTFVDSEDLPVHRADAIRMRPGGDLQMYRSGNHE